MKYLLAILLLTGCVENLEKNLLNSNEFYYRQEVLIINGFYKGHKGLVINEGKVHGDCGRLYEVWLDETNKTVEICSKNLALEKK